MAFELKHGMFFNYTKTEKKKLDKLFDDVEKQAQQLKESQEALREYVADIRKMYDLPSTVQIGTSYHLRVIQQREADQKAASDRSAEAMTKLPEEVREKYETWVAKQKTE